MHYKKLKPSAAGFTLVEIMVAVAVLAILMTLIMQLFSSAITFITQTDRTLDGDAQARAVFDRMAVDFGLVLKRPDIDYFLKDSVHEPMAGNDQLAFYSQVPGYASSTGQQSPVSLVAYRINSSSTSPYYNQLERLGYGLTWNGGSPQMAVSFSASPTSFSPNTITSNPNWQGATTMQPSPNYEELIGAGVFRIEYYYTIRGRSVVGATGSTTTLPSILSAVPWDTRSTGTSPAHTSINGMQDVAAITVVLAIIDPNSQEIVANNSQMMPEMLALGTQMKDFDSTTMPAPGYLEAQWQSAINAGSGLPNAVTSGIRVHRRVFYLPQD